MDVSDCLDVCKTKVINKTAGMNIEQKLLAIVPDAKCFRRKQHLRTGLFQVSFQERSGVNSKRKSIKYDLETAFGAEALNATIEMV